MPLASPTCQTKAHAHDGLDQAKRGDAIKRSGLLACPPHHMDKQDGPCSSLSTGRPCDSLWYLQHSVKGRAQGTVAERREQTKEHPLHLQAVQLHILATAGTDGTTGDPAHGQGQTAEL